MSKKLGDILNTLFTKAGIDTDNPSVVALLQNEVIFKADIEDTVAEQMQSNLHTVESARAKLTNEIKALTYAGVDAELNTAMAEMELSEDLKASILAERSTPKRAALLAKKIKETESAKSQSNNKGEKAELQNEINQLKALHSQTQNDYKAQIDALKSQHENEAIDWQLTSSLSTYNYALGDIAPELKIQTAKTALANAMSAEGVKVVKENNQLKLVTAKDGTDYFSKQNTKVDLKAFVEQTLAQNKLLAVSNGQAAAPVKTNGQTITTPQTPAQQAFLKKLEADLSSELA